MCINKYLPILLLLFFGGKSYGQLAPSEVVGKVSYLQLFSFPGEEPSEKELDLFLGKSKGLFIRKTDEEPHQLEENKPKISQTEDGLNLSYNYETNHRWPMHTDLTTNHVVSEAILFHRGGNTEFVILEERVPVRWKLSKDEKAIGGVMCRKATGYFRGRDYIAWYAPEIPIRLGPWKFNGLPGLILEIYDTKKHVFFSATSISIPSAVTELPTTWLHTNKPVKQISLKESVIISRGQEDEIFQSILAKLPRGATLDIDEKEVNTIETRYEFDFE